MSSPAPVAPEPDRAADREQWDAWATEAMRRRLVAFAVRYVGDAWEAEDVVQETLLRARESLPRLRARDRGEAWLFRICRHAAIDHVRSRHVRRAVWTPLGPEHRGLEMAGAGAGSAAGAASGQETAPAPQDAPAPFARELPLRSLPAHQRVLVSLHYEHGLSQPALCRMTGLSASALRVRLFRARNALLAAARRGRSRQAGRPARSP